MLIAKVTNWYKRNKSNSKKSDVRLDFCRTYKYNDDGRLDKTKPSYQLTIRDINTDKILTLDFQEEYFTRFVEYAYKIKNKPIN